MNTILVQMNTILVQMNTMLVQMNTQILVQMPIQQAAIREMGGGRRGGMMAVLEMMPAGVGRAGRAARLSTERGVIAACWCQ
jgi:hypothetical protein